MRGTLAAIRDTVVVVLLVGLCAASVWAWYAGPCWIYSFAKAGDVPARCVMTTQTK